MPTVGAEIFGFTTAYLRGLGFSPLWISQSIRVIVAVLPQDGPESVWNIGFRRSSLSALSISLAEGRSSALPLFSDCI